MWNGKKTLVNKTLWWGNKIYVQPNFSTHAQNLKSWRVLSEWEDNKLIITWRANKTLLVGKQNVGSTNFKLHPHSISFGDQTLINNGCTWTEQNVLHWSYTRMLCYLNSSSPNDHLVFI